MAWKRCLNNNICRWAAGRGLRRICGEYVATAKNDLVREHYAGLGYAKIADDGNGHTRWEMPLAADSASAVGVHRGRRDQLRQRVFVPEGDAVR